MSEEREVRRRARVPARPVLLVLAGVYLLGYLVLRSTSTEVWERDGRSYVIFPAGPAVLYFLYRPLSYLDQALTGTGAHLGPHP